MAPSITSPVNPQTQSCQRRLDRSSITLFKLRQRRVSTVNLQNRLPTTPPPVSLSEHKKEVSDSFSLAISEDTTTSTNNSTIQQGHTKGQAHFVGRLQIDLPVLSLTQEHLELPITPPLSLSSHSMPSSVATTPSPPLHTDYADGYMYPWNSSSASPLDETQFHSITTVDPIEIKSQLSVSSSLEDDLFHLYFERIHPSFPVLSLDCRHSTPLCLHYAILALSSLHYYDQQQYQPYMTGLSQRYYDKACKYLNSHGMNDIVSAQTLLILYKYHETLGQSHDQLLERTRWVLDYVSRAMDDHQEDEWLCRLKWIAYLCHFGGSDTLTVTWEDPPLIRLPSLLSSEQHDQDQINTISQLIDTIHTANIYTSAMQSLCTPADDHWTFRRPPDSPSL